MEPLHFRAATRNDQPRILQIIRQAQRRMAAAGSQQWQDGYPAAENIEADLEKGVGYVLHRSTAASDGTDAATGRNEEVADGDNPVGAVVAYGAIVFDGEPAYDHLDGEWLTDGPYVVVHRLAVADEALGNGIGTEFLKRAERLARKRGIRAFRIDTNFDNRRMLRILDRLGFVRCGEVAYRGAGREAFEKRI